MGGASVAYWGEIAERHGLDLTVVNPNVDPQFGFMTLDWDGKIRMDCSSPYAMASLVARRGDYQIATGNDADADRHGIVTSDGGLMNPNHYLAVAIGYLYANRPGLAGRHRHRQDGRQLVDDRLRRARPGQAPGRDPRRVQVVRAGPDRLVDRVRRRGERGGVVPAHRRHRVDHRQGRPHPLPARLGDPGGHRADAQRALPGADAAVRRARVRPDRRRLQQGRQGEAGQARRRATSRRRSWPATRSPSGSPRPRATARRSAV